MDQMNKPHLNMYSYISSVLWYACNKESVELCIPWFSRVPASIVHGFQLVVYTWARLFSDIQVKLEHTNTQGAH